MRITVCSGGRPPAPTPPPVPTPPPTPIPPPTPAPTPSPAMCKVGDPVLCPGASYDCAGDQCCQDGTTCPSADNSWKGCPKPKTVDCTAGIELVASIDVVV